MATAATASEYSAPPPHIRQTIREQLTQAKEFGALDEADRRDIAHSLVKIAHAAKLLDAEIETKKAAAPASQAMTAGERFSGAAVDRVASSTRQILDAISFPRFVSELINGVFRAMVETNQAQLQQYVELVRGVSQSLDGFTAVSGNDDMAKRWLAEQFPASFAIDAPDPDDPPDPDDEPEPMRLRTLGAPPETDALRSALGLEPDAVMPSSGSPQELIPFVRQSLARNRQQMLATMVQMGMQRIVVDSGRISAGMRFHIDASSAAAEQNTSAFDTRTSIGASASGGIGLWSASASVNSTIGYVSTNDTRTSEDLNASADLTSSVELHFRTDQVPLDRIASQNTVQRLAMNTLNPEREIELNRQMDDARLSRRGELDTARASRAAPALAPTPAATAPAAPTLDVGAITGGTRAGTGTAA
jgi:hypothetical protein